LVGKSLFFSRKTFIDYFLFAIFIIIAREIKLRSVSRDESPWGKLSPVLEIDLAIVAQAGEKRK